MFFSLSFGHIDRSISSASTLNTPLHTHTAHINLKKTTIAVLMSDQRRVSAVDELDALIGGLDKTAETGSIAELDDLLSSLAVSKTKQQQRSSARRSQRVSGLPGTLSALSL